MPGWHTPPCPAPSSRSSAAPATSRSTTTPDRFVEVVEKFIDATAPPAEYDQDALRELLRTGLSERLVTGSLDTRVAVLDALGADERSAT